MSKPATFTRVEVRHDRYGFQESFATGDQRADLNAAFEYILRHQGQSVSYATRYGGWDIVAVAADGTLWCGVCGTPHPHRDQHTDRY